MALWDVCVHRRLGEIRNGYLEVTVVDEVPIM